MRGKWFAVSVLLWGLVLGVLVNLGTAQGTEPEGGAAPQALVGTGFTYQGRLNKGGIPYNGTCYFHVSLHDSLSDGNQLGNIQSIGPVEVMHGLFSVVVNSGNQFGDDAFTGERRWLAIEVQCTGDSSYTPLEPRQELTPAPYAFALPGLRTEQSAYSPNVIGGYNGNMVTSGAYGASIGGGGDSARPNRVTDGYGTVGGGIGNQAGNDNAYGDDARCGTVGGGSDNTASGTSATVAGGVVNDASGNNATVGGGLGNHASGTSATVGGGYQNLASGLRATVGGGLHNTASGFYATVAGGEENEATGWNSFAAGHWALAHADGCFAWGDNTEDTHVNCDTDNRWKARASGGVYFLTDSWQTSGVYIVAGGSSWSSLSDRALKENVAAVDTQQLLARLAQVPVSTWNYKSQDASVRHIGPMAQDFYAAFGVGEDDRAITTIDADGVALAAIQGLYEQNQALAEENATLQEQVDDLEARLAALESKLGAGPSSLWGGALLLPGLGLSVVGLGVVWVARRKWGGG